MTMRLDSRQSRQRSALDQLTNSTDQRLDVILNLINDELTMPLRMSADATPSLRLNIGAIEVQTLDGSNGTGRKRTIQPISNLLPSFTAGFMTFPASSGGTITASGFSLQSAYTLTISSGQYMKVMVALNSLGQVVLSFGTQGASEAAATLPVALSGTLALGYVVLQNIGGVIQNVTDANIRQFAGGGGGGGSGASSKQVTQASHGFKVGNVVYLNSSGVYVLAQADTKDKAEAVGMVSSVVTTNIFEVTELGYVSGIDVANVTAPVVANLTVGEVYFLSATDAGKIVVTEPSIIGNISKPMLIADSTNSGYVLNYRGSVVGGTNARTELSFTNVTTAQNIQDFSGYEAGEITGWVYIDATPDLRFYVAAQFSRGGNGNYNLSYQTSGDTPPTGFSVSITNAGQMQLTLSSGGVSGFSSAKLNYALNAPAIGATFPLAIDAGNVTTGTVAAARLPANLSVTELQAATSGGITFKEDGGTTTGTVSDAGAWTFGPSSGLTSGHTVQAGTSSSTAFCTFRNSTAADVRINIGSASGGGSATFNNDSASAAGFEWRQGGTNILGTVSSAGVWDLGPTAAQGNHVNRIRGSIIYGGNQPTASSGYLYSDSATNIAAGGIADFAIGRAGGILTVWNKSTANSNNSTFTTYSYIKMGVTSPALTSLATQNGVNSAAAFSISYPNDTTIRITNNAAFATDIKVAFYGCQTGN